MSDAAPARDWDALADDLDEAAVARAAVYERLAATVSEPDRPVYESFADDRFAADLRELVGESGLDIAVPTMETDGDFETTCARYNDLFHVGHSADSDTGAPVPPYESTYRDDASWNEVNVDLARAYDYFGLGVDTDSREHHDHVRLELDFAGYLCRREAAVGDGAARARLDFHDRHLAGFLEAMADRVAEQPSPGVYEPLLTFAAAFAAADRDELDRRCGP